MSAYPRVFKVRQLFDVEQVDDVAAAVDSSLAALDLGAKIQAGDTVAISAGSRGIANIDIAIGAIVKHLQVLDMIPLIKILI